MKQKWVIIWMSFLSVLGVGCKNPTPDPDPKPEMDKYPELVSACFDWKQGGGAGAIGAGDKCAIYVVTSLEDKDAAKPVSGTLRYALENTGARVIIFKVSGTIQLDGPLEITHGNVSILGQSAPGQGICIAGYPLIIKNTRNVVIRFLHFRMGDEHKEEYDALSVNNCQDVILDHCSCSWSTDECVSCYGNKNFTLQYCIISESLRNSVHGKGKHGYGGIWGGTNATFHHNLLAHHDSRNPRFDHDYVDISCKGPIDYVNNVVYNWGDNSTYGGEGVDSQGSPRQINFVANYYKPGPATHSSRKNQLLNPTTKCEDHCLSKYDGNVLPGHFYITGNYMSGATDVTNDNWLGVRPDESEKTELCKRTTRAEIPSIKEQTAEQAYETVLTKAGCSLWRDAVDERIIAEVREGKFTFRGSNGSTGGLIDTQSDVGGWPELKTGSQTDIDSDKDGIPDVWEQKYGLDPNKTDARISTLVTGFTNIEVYLCDLVKSLY